MQVHRCPADVVGHPGANHVQRTVAHYRDGYAWHLGIREQRVDVRFEGHAPIVAEVLIRTDRN